ncbi:MAG: co-chaperone GroES [Anaerolineales bacterium]|jgi:chaperonin GroES|nr:co-chaperone GroES [Anaerolineales bacterium]
MSKKELGIKPLGVRVVIQPIEEESRTDSGLYIPDTAKEKPQTGVVVAIGEGSKKVPITVKVGEKVLFPKYTGTEIKLGNQEYKIMKFEEVLAVLE